MEAAEEEVSPTSQPQTGHHIALVSSNWDPTTDLYSHANVHFQDVLCGFLGKSWLVVAPYRACYLDGDLNCFTGAAWIHNVGVD